MQNWVKASAARRPCDKRSTFFRCAPFDWRALASLCFMSWILLGGASPVSAGDAPLTIGFDQPASDWEREGLPIGNGAMGAVVQGGVQQDVLQFNEKTLWTGGPGSSKGY